MNSIFRRWLDRCKRRIMKRLDHTRDTMTFEPQFAASNIHYEVSAKTGAISCGGIGAYSQAGEKHRLGRCHRPIACHLLKFHLLYQESDHVLNIAYNALCNGTCLQDIELRRNDENFLNALGTRRIPDPYHGRRNFALLRAGAPAYIHRHRQRRASEGMGQAASLLFRVRQDRHGRHENRDNRRCKHGMDVSYDGLWCYHPLLLTLANTGEVLSVINRSGSRPSHEGAAAEADRAVQLCIKAGFRKIVLAPATHSSRRRHLDRWDCRSKSPLLLLASTPNRN